MFPKKIHLTCKDKNNIGNPVWIECYKKYKEMYKDYKIELYDNKDIYRIIAKHFPEHLKIVKGIKNGGVLADTFRYLILYLRGGIYSDMDCEPLKHINGLLTKIQYHGNENRIFNIYSSDMDVKKGEYIYHRYPCNNCKLVSREKIIKYKCLGHKYINKETDIIVGEEFSERYGHNRCEQYKYRMFNYRGRRVGICQWFMITKAKQLLFKTAYLTCIKNIKSNMDMQKNMTEKEQLINYVLITTGPTMFSKIVVAANLNNKKLILLPADFFAACSGGSNDPTTKVSITDNSYVRHHFTSSWQ